MSEAPAPARRLRGPVASLLRDVVVAAAVLILVVVFLVQPFRVEGASMEPTLRAGQRIFVSKLSYRLAEARRHDVVVLRGPDGRTIVKRLVALPGERVEIVAGQVLVDGKALVEDYVRRERRLGDDTPPLTLGPDEYFVLGDNRAGSLDSRRYGPVGGGRIRGKAVFRYWPPSEVGALRSPASAPASETSPPG